jgi:hypothetical protein
MTLRLACGSAITSVSLALAASSGFLALEAPSAHAYTVLQSFADTYTLDPIPFGNSTAYGPPSTFTVLPVDASIGSLLSTTTTWETSGAGVATASSNGGALTLANGGATLVNSSTCGGCCGRALVAPDQLAPSILANQAQSAGFARTRIISLD